MVQELLLRDFLYQGALKDFYIYLINMPGLPLETLGQVILADLGVYNCRMEGKEDSTCLMRSNSQLMRKKQN